MRHRCTLQPNCERRCILISRVSKILCLCAIVFITGCQQREIEDISPDSESFIYEQIEYDSSIAYVLELINCGYENGSIQVDHYNHDSTSISFTIGDKTSYPVRVSRSTQGNINALWFNEKKIVGEPPVVYKSANMVTGDEESLPTTVKVLSSSEKLAFATPYAIYSQEYLNILLNGGFEFNGYIASTYNRASELILARVLDNDYLTHYFASDNCLYAQFRTAQGAEYLIWYDGSHLTLAGATAFFTEEV